MTDPRPMWQQLGFPPPRPERKKHFAPPVCDTAIAALWGETDPFLTLHNLSTNRQKPPIGHPRGNITSKMSPASRARLLQRTSRIAKKPGTYFLTLTMPGPWQIEWTPFQKFFENWCKRMERKFPTMWIVWKREFQRRGAPHLHCLLRIPNSTAYLAEIEEYGRTAWNNLFATHIDTEALTHHLTHGFDIEIVRLHQKARTYLAKSGINGELSKTLQTDDSEYVKHHGSLGRPWGIKNRHNFDTDLEETRFLKINRRTAIATRAVLTNLVNKERCTISPFLMTSTCRPSIVQELLPALLRHT